LSALVAGTTDGVVGRTLMRVFAVVGDGTPAFTVGGSASIVFLFVLSAVPGAIASALVKRRMLTVLLYIAGAVPVVWNGLVIGLQEWSAALNRGVDATEVVMLVVVTAGIVVVTLGNPIFAHSLAVRLAHAQKQSGRRLQRSHQ
jgi:hypothetical protein